MQIINSNLLLLQEKEWKAPKSKKSEPVPESNPNVVGEATIVLSKNAELKKGDRVLINRTGLLDIEVGKKKLIILDVNDVLVKL